MHAAFAENYCNICLECFCCKSCRTSHETDKHGCHPECDICRYGRTLLKNPSYSLLQHYKTKHWPLHCVYCKKQFISIKELTLHTVCVMALKKSNQETSVVILPSDSVDENYDSPPITATMHKSILTSSNNRTHLKNKVSLTTSTPMQNTSERELLERIPEVITPVDYSEKTDILDERSLNIMKSNITPSINYLKRRVTFSEIEIVNIQTPYIRSKTKHHTSHEIGLNSKQDLFDSMSNSNISEMYITTTGEQTPKITAYQDAQNSINITNYQELLDNTAYESALMVSQLTDADITEPISDHHILKSEDSLLNTQVSPKKSNYVMNQDNCPLEIEKKLFVSNVLVPTNTLEFLQNSQNLISNKNNDFSVKERNFTKLDITSQENPPLAGFSADTARSTILQSTVIEVPRNTINEYLDQPKYSISMDNASTSKSSPLQKEGIWSSMATIVKTIVHGFSGSAAELNSSNVNQGCVESRKRLKSYDTSEEDRPMIKRIKVMDIKCRKTIRTLRPHQEINYSKKNVQNVDKWTQTD